ncbi:ComF family protein [Ideonella sp. BN130291]|uniref:ComF family protein n=1 Tax=Ideonella sp. BN130291 TaxID=3112940 RepID=UPI002E25EE0E|nr:ComF family protein [Ideonella sp. BN130291]
MPLPPPLPSLCAVCHRWARGRLCNACLTRFGSAVPRCLQCALRVPHGVQRCGACLRRPGAPVDASVAAVDYAFPWDGLIAGYKFHQRLDLAGALARLLHAALVRQPELPPATLVLPVPLSRERLRERGYNQAWELARRVARWRGTQANAGVLSRIRDTAHQLGLSESERVSNLRGAFLVEPGQAQHLQGRTVALVDDVLTSGATAHEAARVLRAAGAAQVQLWVVARTAAPADA